MEDRLWSWSFMPTAWNPKEGKLNDAQANAILRRFKARAAAEAAAHGVHSRSALEEELGGDLYLPRPVQHAVGAALHAECLIRR